MTFTEKQTDPTSPMHWRGNMQADYFYPSGAAGDKFFKHILQNETFLATECPKCEKILFPPRLYCEDCFEEIPDSNWVEVPEGTTLKDIQWIPTHEKKAIHIPKKKIMKVKGSKGNEYVLTYKDGKVTCTCPGFKFRRKCKHQELMK